MYYLQDYMEKLELLPDEIKNGFAAMQQLDLEVQNSMIRTGKRVDILFSRADNMDPNELQTRFKAIMEEGEKSVEKTENKIQLASRMQGLLTKYLKRLDDDLRTMKTELEANSSGITELIEQSVLDSEQSDNTKIANQKENKCQIKKCALEDKKKITNNNRNVKRKSTTTTSHTVTSESVTKISQPSTSLAKPLMDLTKEPLKTSNTAVEVAVSEVITAVQQQSTQGRKPTSLKTSLKTIESEKPSTDQMHCASNKLSKDILINEELARVYKLLNPNADKITKQNELKEIQNTDTSAEEDVHMEESVNPDEPLYCICKNVAYGMMVACDNEECPSEWFHYECVGILCPPKGKWFCPQCIVKMKNQKLNK